MRAINVLLSIVVSLAILALLLEGGLRLIGKGPPKTPLEFHPELGWAKKPGFGMTKRTPEFKAHFALNELGLRGDPIGPKAPDEFRVIALGDSFTYGFAVERDQHFVDLLEGYWRSEGRNVRVINAGTEAYDTAQAARWFELEGKKLDPDLVLLFPYENDLYWNSRAQYQTGDGPRDKPRYNADGTLDARTINRPPPKSWISRYALTRWLVPIDAVGLASHRTPIFGATAPIDREVIPLLAIPPSDLVAAMELHTRGALRALQAATRDAGAELALAPIPSAALYEPHWKSVTTQRLSGLAESQWSADRPVDAFLDMARQEGLVAVDARSALHAARGAGEPLYHGKDWHFNERGSRVFAAFLHDTLEGRVTLPPKTSAGALPPIHTDAGGVPFALTLYVGLLAVLTGLYWVSYPKENRLLAPVKIGLLLGAVFGIFLGVIYLRDLLPPLVAMWLIPGFVVLVLGFVAYKLGRRLGTITELLGAFIRRGHWYLMPLVVVLVTIGSLLVVAASSPLIAPFIYTLF